MPEINISAPGKVILHGEHAVVYGKRALAASLNIRTNLHMTDTQDGQLSLHLPNINITQCWDLTDLVACFNNMSSGFNMEDLASVGVFPECSDTKHLALIAVLDLFYHLFFIPSPQSLPSLKITITSDLPPGAGLGSSAAFSTCLAAAFLLKQGKISKPTALDGDVYPAPWHNSGDLELINEWAFKAEKVIHGKPSGIDNSISTYGGVLCYQSGSITHLKSSSDLKILLTNTKVPRSTKKLVEGVRILYNKYPDVISPLMDSVEEISNKCEEILIKSGATLSKESEAEMMELARINQGLLNIIGVGHTTIDKICEVSKQYGLSSKLTGAGGGGCCMTLIPQSSTDDAVSDIIKTLQDDMDKLGFESWYTSVGGPGIMLH